MGSYADNLSRRIRGAAAKPAAPKEDVERLKCCAIERDGKVHDGLHSHYELRRALGDACPEASNMNDVEGFLTTKGRFVGRQEAQDVALAAGQIRALQRRPLLSSDIDW